MGSFFGWSAVRRPVRGSRFAVRGTAGSGLVRVHGCLLVRGTRLGLFGFVARAASSRRFANPVWGANLFELNRVASSKPLRPTRL